MHKYFSQSPLFKVLHSNLQPLSEHDAYAAVALSQTEDDQSSIAIQLLSDIRQIISDKGIGRISYVDLIEALCADEERPWLTFKQGAKITARQVAYKLRGFDIRSKPLRIYGKPQKGYELQDCVESFQRYLAPDPGKEGLQVTNSRKARRKTD